jgi:hypothetical protein
LDEARRRLEPSVLQYRPALNRIIVGRLVIG